MTIFCFHNQCKLNSFFKNMCELNRMLFPAKREALKVSRHRVALRKSLRQKYAPLQPEQQEPRLKGGNGTRYISLQRLRHGKKLILRRSIGCEILWWPCASFSPKREVEKFFSTVQVPQFDRLKIYPLKVDGRFWLYRTTW